MLVLATVLVYVSILSASATGFMYLTQAEEADAHMFREGQERWFDPLEREHDNLRAALRWSVEREDGQRKEIAWRLAGALQLFWTNYGYVREGQHFVERVLAKSEGVAASVKAKALNGAGWVALVTQCSALLLASLMLP
jgi:hypothetical protein